MDTTCLFLAAFCNGVGTTLVFSEISIDRAGGTTVTCILETYIKPIKLPHPRFYLNLSKVFAHRSQRKKRREKRRYITSAIYTMNHFYMLYLLLWKMETRFVMKQNDNNIYTVLFFLLILKNHISKGRNNNNNNIFCKKELLL